jgi:hypothetical protein
MRGLIAIATLRAAARRSRRIDVDAHRRAPRSCGGRLAPAARAEAGAPALAARPAAAPALAARPAAAPARAARPAAAPARA